MRLRFASKIWGCKSASAGHGKESGSNDSIRLWLLKIPSLENPRARISSLLQLFVASSRPASCTMFLSKSDILRRPFRDVTPLASLSKASIAWRTKPITAGFPKRRPSQDARAILAPSWPISLNFPLAKSDVNLLTTTLISPSQSATLMLKHGVTTVLRNSKERSVAKSFGVLVQEFRTCFCNDTKSNSRSAFVFWGSALAHSVPWMDSMTSWITESGMNVFACNSLADQYFSENRQAERWVVPRASAFSFWQLEQQVSLPWDLV